MKQLILPSDFSGEQLYTLGEQDSHYLINVQRKEIGYTFNLLDEKGNKYSGKIVNYEDKLCTLQLEPLEGMSESKFSITLLQGIPKGKKIDLMIRQAVEAGVSEFVPITAEHSIPTFSSDQDKNKKRDRWNKIIKEASQQSGTSSITNLAPIKSFKEAIEDLERPFTGIFFHQVPMMNQPLHKLLDNNHKSIVLVVGPEGGISNKEVDFLVENGFKPALLGPNILRAETATTFSLGAVEMILHEKDYWSLKE